jgi:hypothetical protein
MLAITFSAVGADKVDLTGEWKVDLTIGENGQTYHPKLKLKQQGSDLTGVFISSLDNAETKIEKGTVKDGQVEFKVVREFEGQSVTSTYKGKIEKDGLKGTAELERDGQSITAEFSAQRAKDEPKDKPAGGLSSKYSVSVTSADGQQFSTSFTLKEEKDKLSGVYTSILDGSDIPFKKVERTGNKIRMELQRERDGRKLEINFDGEIKGDKIVGKVKYDAGEQSGEGEFEATKEK